MQHENGTRAATTSTRMQRETGSGPNEFPASAQKITTAAERQSMIWVAAYLRAEKRGFRGSDPIRDWFEAEREVDAKLRGHGWRRPPKHEVTATATL